MTMSREFASPDLANLIAARLPPEEFDRRAGTPLSDTEASEIAELVTWFSRRYPTAKERLAYARRKLRQYAATDANPPASADYPAIAKRLARSHRQADPATVHVFLVPDPQQKAIRLLEVTRSAPPALDLVPVGFAARPDLGVPFPLTLLLLHPDDWEAAQQGRTALPDGCPLDTLVAL
jgi:hypothetical protein